jgi:hypothetical protein
MPAVSDELPLDLRDRMKQVVGFIHKTNESTETPPAQSGS